MIPWHTFAKRPHTFLRLLARSAPVVLSYYGQAFARLSPPQRVVPSGALSSSTGLLAGMGWRRPVVEALCGGQPVALTYHRQVVGVLVPVKL